MSTQQTELIYEFYVKDLTKINALKQLADHAVKEIKSITVWDAEVQITVEPEAKDKHLFTVSMSVFGLHEPVIVKKNGKNILSVFRKVKKTALRQTYRINDKRINFRKKQLLRSNMLYN